MSGVHKHPTISFRVSDREREMIEAKILASGMQKKDYFVRSCIYNRICVAGKKEVIYQLVEEYATAVERDGRFDAGNSFRGILYELGKLLERFKELIKEGLCWFPRLMRWKTSVGEIAPVFRDTDNGYNYSVCGYMNVETKV